MLNCLIIDDEPLARMQIEKYVSRVPFLKLAGSVRNTIAGKNIIDNEPIDLIFLDINMPGMNGIEFIKSHKLFQQVILITAFSAYALDGFEIEATDYLMKPVTFERFKKSAEKAYARVKGSDNVKTIDQQPSFFYIKHNQRYEKVMFNDILYIESMLNYIGIITKSERYIVYSSLKSVESKLPANKFIRVHRSYIVALSKINAISFNQVSISGHNIPVSRAYKDTLVTAALKTGSI
jgi:DNA-binding LytR/AlgR family response regulator